MGPTAHLQVLGDPFQTHCRFLSQPGRQPRYPFIPFARLAQGAIVPSQPAYLHPPIPPGSSQGRSLRQILDATGEA